MNFMDLGVCLWNGYHTHSVCCHPSVYSQRGITPVQYFGVYNVSVNKRTSWYSKPLFSSMANF